MKRKLHKFRIAIADDHSLIRLGLKIIIDKIPEYIVIGEASTPHELSLLLRHTRCDILITDFFMPDKSHRDGLSMLQSIRRHSPDLTILVVTMLENPLLISALLHVGINGLLSKITVEKNLEYALLKITTGERFLDPHIYKILNQSGLIKNSGIILLSPSEVDILYRFQREMSINAIAKDLAFDRSKVIQLSKSAMDKIGLDTTAELEEFLRHTALHQTDST